MFAIPFSALMSSSHSTPFHKLLVPSLLSSNKVFDPSQVVDRVFTAIHQGLHGSRKPKIMGGRIVATVLQHHQPPLRPSTSEHTENHGLMAPRFRMNTLVCFYCNKKSGIKYDGLITQWDCDTCGSENFLDEVRPASTNCWQRLIF